MFKKITISFLILFCALAADVIAGYITKGPTSPYSYQCLALGYTRDSPRRAMTYAFLRSYKLQSFVGIPYNINMLIQVNIPTENDPRFETGECYLSSQIEAYLRP